MSIFNFVSQEEIDDLDEDPRIAFKQLASAALKTLDERSANIDTREESEWRVLNELRFSCMNIILAAASRFEITAFDEIVKPQLRNFNDADWFEFRHDVDHYVAQIALDIATRNRANSVVILPRTKDRIRGYIYNLRQAIEQGNLDEKKREALLKKLKAVEDELEKRRTSMIAVANLAFQIWAIPGGAWSTYEVGNTLITKVMHSIAEAKADEEEHRQIAAPETPKALAPPRKAAPTDDWARPKSDDWQSSEWTANGDDDLPF